MSTTPNIARLASYYVASGNRRNGLAPALRSDAFDIEVVKSGNRWGWIIRFEGVNVLSEAHPVDYDADAVCETIVCKTRKAAVATDILADGWTRHCIAQFFAGAAYDVRYGNEIPFPVEVVEAFAARFLPAEVTA